MKALSLIGVVVGVFGVMTSAWQENLTATLWAVAYVFSNLSLLAEAVRRELN